MSWIEKYILLELTRNEHVRAKDLCPDNIEQNLLSHYLKKLINGGYVEKTGRGVYSLTILGQRLVGTFSTKTNSQTHNIKTCIGLYAKTKDDQYLLFKWSRQPYLGKVSLLTDRMKFGDGLQDALRIACLDKLGKVLPLEYLNQGFVRITKDEILVSHMHLLVYQVKLGDLVFPIESRNGSAILTKVNKSKDIMYGIEKLLVDIRQPHIGFDVELRY